MPNKGDFAILTFEVQPLYYRFNNSGIKYKLRILFLDELKFIHSPTFELNPFFQTNNQTNIIENQSHP
jgi:hypothetical protein